MPEPTPPPAPTPPPKRTRGQVNRAHLDELANARKVAAAATDPAHASALAAVELDPTLATQITALAGQTDTAIGQLTGARAGKKEMTTQEKTARDALIAVIAPIQTAVKRKFTGDQADMRDAYGADRYQDARGRRFRRKGRCVCSRQHALGRTARLLHSTLMKGSILTNSTVDCASSNNEQSVVGSDTPGGAREGLDLFGDGLELAAPDPAPVAVSLGGSARIPAGGGRSISFAAPGWIICSVPGLHLDDVVGAGLALAGASAWVA